MAVRELWLVRHAESVGNAAATRAEIEGLDVIPLELRDADVPLSTTGRQQAAALATWVAQRPDAVDLHYTSPYVRARETLGIALGGRSSTPVIIDERLRDRELGILDLLTREGVARLHPEEARRRLRIGKYYHRPPGGESWADVALRLRTFLGDLSALEASSVMIVAHDAVVMILLSLLLPWDEAELLEFATSHTVLNASVTHVTRTSGAWSLELFSDVSHLVDRAVPVTVHPGSPDVEPQ